MLFLNRECCRFIQLIEEWIKDDHEIHLVFYEDIVEDPIREARKMIQFLNIVNLDEITLEQRIACQEKNRTDLFKWFHRGENIKGNPYDHDTRTLINQTINKVDAILKQSGFKGLSLEKYHYL